jgi:hypothetical protein
MRDLGDRVRMDWAILVVQASRLHRKDAGETPAPQLGIDQVIAAVSLDGHQFGGAAASCDRRLSPFARARTA